MSVAFKYAIFTNYERHTHTYSHYYWSIPMCKKSDLYTTKLFSQLHWILMDIFAERKNNYFDTKHFILSINILSNCQIC